MTRSKRKTSKHSSKKLSRKLREEDEEEQFESYHPFLEDFEDLLIGEALKLDQRRIKRRKLHGDYVI